MPQSATREVRPDGKLRLPPGQRLTADWPVLHYGSIPRLDPKTWQFHVWGLVEEERKFTWDEFNDLGNMTDTSDIHCVTTWSKFDNDWEGVPFKAVYDAIKVKPEAKVVMVHSYGGYTTNVPLEDLLAEGVLFARTHNGEALTNEHGWPMRLVVPHLYFWKSAKWVGGMQFIDEDRPGFWEMYGYHMYGDPWLEQRYS
ncbi:MAG: sulfite oxidase-like oxidoreductase [Dehalococcoidia bacterium]|nr:sulfite oxidase-like oxidoreductase [Dehalococcoidia bacterium]HCV00725.1 sulfite oxidase-like oxidoreductase [Dehalococcoidia bacterium]|tara:strand:+ start:6847 stop:7440 length:594 start_codon:yes stop_codon:yes gene_type:complete